jgi:hypothetical protein
MPRMQAQLRRIVDWHLCRPQIQEARAASQMTEREASLVRRAKSALSAGNHLLEAPERTGEGLAGAHAGTLYLESIHWALWSARTDLERPELEALWNEGRSVVDELGLSAEQITEVKRFVAMQKPALELPELAERDQEAAAMLLRQVASRTLEVRCKKKRAYERIALKRVLRFALSVTVLLGLVLGATALLPEKRNIAAGKPWTTSSKLYECHPQKNECGGVETKMFFCTKEESNPWFQYDLGSKTRVSSMTIVNRQDGGVQSRAVPLIVEVSDDGKTFREVIRRSEEFSTWKPKFASQEARYVRLRVAKKSFLHLEAVRIHS